MIFIFRKKSLLSAIFAPFLLALFLIFVVGCENESDAGTDTAPESGSTTGTSRKPLTEEYLTTLAGSRWDSPQKVKSATISSQGDDKFIDIKAIRPEACHDGAVLGISATFVQKMMAALFKYPEVARVEITIYGTTTETPDDEPAVKVAVDRATAQKIDWFQFSDRTMSSLATEYYVHPRILQSYNTEGGDPSGPRPQTAPTTGTSST